MRRLDRDLPRREPVEAIEPVAIGDGSADAKRSGVIGHGRDARSDRRPAVGPDDAPRHDRSGLQGKLEVLDVLPLRDLDPVELRLAPAGGDRRKGDLARVHVLVNEAALVVRNRPVANNHLDDLPPDPPAGGARHVDLRPRDRFAVRAAHHPRDLRRRLHGDRQRLDRRHVDPRLLRVEIAGAGEGERCLFAALEVLDREPAVGPRRRDG